MSIEMQIVAQARRAREASRRLGRMLSVPRDAVLTGVAAALNAQADDPDHSPILSANAKDYARAKEGGANAAFLDRLALNPARMREMATSLLHVAALPDPIGQIERTWRRPNGLEIGQARVPLGVVGIIYEARPNVTVEAWSLCLKSGNACILKGGSDGIDTNRALVEVIVREGCARGLPEGFVEFIDSVDRTAVNVLLQQDQYVDLVVPRGGESLIRAVVAHSKIPVVRQYKGVCHTYVDDGADLEMACRIAVNAKVSRPATCNAMETLLVHRTVAPAFLPQVARELRAKGVELRGCATCRELVPDMREATDADWAEEYLDLILAVRVVNDLDDALDHIARYGTLHSESIITRDVDRARRFQREVDAACVYVNASTRFTDGFQFGFGAEVGISTGKIHSRGPMGLEDLTTKKYLVWGDGQTRE
jgi:glutamate-5-semialdehyde dehydrogenase